MEVDIKKVIVQITLHTMQNKYKKILYFGPVHLYSFKQKVY